MRAARRSALAVACSVSALLQGCGAYANVEVGACFDEVVYPMSMTNVLLDEQGRRVGGAELEIVGELRVGDGGWGFAWGLVVLDDVHVAEAINAQISAAGGEGAVRVSLRVDACVSCSNWNYVGQFVPLVGLLPIYPTPIYLSVGGDIVRRRARG